MSVASLVMGAARRTPEAIAVVGPEGAITYGQLDRWAAALAVELAELGVGPGDRVALWQAKSAAAVAAMQAVLRCGACYVPIDPASPRSRARRIIADCSARVVVVDHDDDEPAGESRGGSGDPPRLRVGSEAPASSGAPIEPPALVTVDPEQLAYILYTSGSTGAPKGVCISHRAALAFVRWAHDTLGARPDDRFASHAPFHFDLSVLDLYAAFMAGARVCLVPEGLAYAPARLVEFIREHEISVWYSVPSVLMLMMEHGELLGLQRPPRALLFAGEVFPIKHLRALWERFGATCRLLNLYGPTETNVCTAHEVTHIEPERTTPVPIGEGCGGDEVWAVTAEGRRAEVGETGELWVRGPTVMSGYWGGPPQGERPYATGDVVRVASAGVFEYVARRDHMLKVRGVRMEPGEIEAALLEHPALHQAAVVVSGEGPSARLVAFVVAAEGAAAPSVLALKRHCAQRLPRAMIIDQLRPLAQLPVNANGKVDRRALVERLGEERSHGRH